MQIDLHLLEEIISKIFIEMKQRGIDSIALDADYYWNVPSASLYDPHCEPDKLDIGQLVDDYDILKLAYEKNSLVSYNLKNVAAIMRFLSEKYSF